MLRWLLFYALFLLLPNPVLAAPAHPFLDQFFRVQTLDHATDPLFFTDPAAPSTMIQTTTVRGQWLILNVWATWCAPCLAELPYFDARAAATPAGVTFWAVSVDQSLTSAQMTATRRRLNLTTLPLYHDRAQTLTTFVNTKSLPVTLVIDPTGYARLALYGAADWSSNEAEDFITHLPRLLPSPKPGYSMKP